MTDSMEKSPVASSDEATSKPGSDTLEVHNTDAQARSQDLKEDENAPLKEEPSHYLGGLKLYIIVFALLLSMFLVSALVPPFRTIVGIMEGVSCRRSNDLPD